MMKVYVAKKNDLTRFLKLFFLSMIVLAVLCVQPVQSALQSENILLDLPLNNWHLVYENATSYYKSGVPSISFPDVCTTDVCDIDLKYLEDYTGDLYGFKHVCNVTIVNINTNNHYSLFSVGPDGGSTPAFGVTWYYYNSSHYQLMCYVGGLDGGDKSAYLSKNVHYNLALYGLMNNTYDCATATLCIYSDGNVDEAGELISRINYSRIYAVFEWSDGENLHVSWSHTNGYFSYRVQDQFLYVYTNFDWFGYYTIFGIGWLGIFIMILIPSWVAWGYKKQGFEVLIERIMLGLVLWLIGFGLFWSWLAGA